MDPAVVAERFAVQRLTGPPASGPVEAVRSLLAVQAQDARGFRLALRVRCVEGISVGDVESALAARELVVSWFCRGTLHLICAEDYAMLQALTTPQLHTAVRTRLAADGVSVEGADRAVAAIERALLDGPLTRAQLVPIVESAGISNTGQTLIHLVFLAGVSGVLVRGPMIGKQHAYVHAREWLGPLWGGAGGADGARAGASAAGPEALAELVRRYLAGHGPASERDIARWAKLTLGNTRTALRRLAGSLEDRGEGLIALAARGRGAEEWPPRPRLAGAFEPVLLGWADRSFVTGGFEAQLISGGVFRPFVMVDGRVAGLWGVRAGRVVVDPPFAPLDGADLSALQAEAADVSRFLGLPGDSATETSP